MHAPEVIQRGVRRSRPRARAFISVIRTHTQKRETDNGKEQDGRRAESGGFGSCVSHALVTVTGDQLRHRYNVQILTKEIIMSVIDAVDGLDGAHVEPAAEAIMNKPVKFINTGMDRLYQVKLDPGKRINDFDEFAALVRSSAGTAEPSSSSRPVATRTYTPSRQRGECRQLLERGVREQLG